MANAFLKAEKIANFSLGVLEREIVLPALVWRDAGGSFRGAAGDTISIRVPARTTARTRTLRQSRGAVGSQASEGQGIITMDELTETKVDVTLDTAPYSAVPITDEDLTLDIVDFGAQVAEPQVRAVAEAVENAVAAEMTGADYATTITMSTTDPFDSIVDARVALNKQNVPMSERRLVVGADFEGLLLKSDELHQVDKAGSDSALRDAAIGRIAGFNDVVVSNALPSNVGFAFHRTAYVLSMQAPAVPEGATYGASRSAFGLAMRWIRDYDFRNVQDRSLFDTYIGTNHVADGAATAEVQTVTISGAPAGGTFTLSYKGQTTTGIAYNAASSAVQSALNALSTIGANGVTVSGSTGGPYTVTFAANKNAEQMTASGSSLTGGTTPSVAVATTSQGSPSFVRAVKLVLA